MKPPTFSSKIFCLAVIMGEFCDSSHGLGFGRRGEIAVISGNPEGFQGEILGTGSDSVLGLILADFFMID
jgi:hypothetical protein